MPNVRKLLPRLVGLLVAIAAAVVILVWWMRQNQPQEIILSGTLEARTVEVGSLTGGRVVRVLVDEGQHVAAGELIAQLETTTIDRQIAEQRAVIDASKANLAKAIAGPRPQEIAKAEAVAHNDAVDSRRLEHLWRDGIAPKEQYDDAATKAKSSSEDLRLLKAGTRKEDIEAAHADVEQQQRRLDTLLKQRAETNVYSSIDGVVQAIGLRPGDIVAPNQTVAELLEANQLWVRVYVPETELNLVHVGQPVTIKLDSGDTFRGHVGAVSSQGEYTPRNVQTRAQRAEEVFGVKVLVDPNPKLKPGMAAQVDLGVKGKPE